MTQFKALFGAALKGLIYSLNFGKRKNKKSGGLLAIGFFAGLCLAMSILYSGSFVFMLNEVGAPETVFGLIALIGVLMNTMFLAFGAKEILFGTKDMDILLAFPVKQVWILGARVAALYAETLLLQLAWMLPTLVSYWLVAGVSVSSLLWLLLITLLLACLPVAFSLLVGYGLAWISSRVRRKALVQNLLYFGLIIVSIAISGIMPSTMIQVETLNAAILYQILGQVCAPIVWVSRLVAFGALLDLAKLIALCLLPLLVLTLLCSLNYGKILAGLSSHSVKNDYKLGQLRTTTASKALVMKEFKRYVNTPIWLFNTGMGLLMLLGSAVASLFFSNQLPMLMQQMEIPSLPLLELAAGVMGFCLSMVAITASSISLEGKQLSVLRGLPISEQQILKGKQTMHMLLCAPFTIVSAVMLGIGLNLGVWGVGVLVVGGLLLNWCVAVLGLVINLAFPKMDAVNDTIVVKQSAACAISIFGGFGLVAFLGVVWAFLTSIGALAVLGALCIGLQLYLNKKGAAQLRRIEL